MKKRAKKTPAQRPAKAELATGEKLPLVEHLHELKRRLFYVAACVAVGAAVTYGFEQKLIAILLRPSHGQHFIYTSPMGGMNFLFGACLDAGLVVATPLIVYHVLAFIQPIMKNTSRRFLFFAAASTGTVAVMGVLFGYFIGLPQALHFLLHQFVSVQVKPLITIQSYMQFVALYLFGSALMFQLPLILLFINRIKPLKPKKLFGYERHLVVAAFIIAFIMNPTPNIVDQLLVVVPIILTYQLGIGLVWLINRGRQSDDLLMQLRQQDELRRAERVGARLLPFPVAPLATEPQEPADFPPHPRVSALNAAPAMAALPTPAQENTAAAAEPEATPQTQPAATPVRGSYSGRMVTPTRRNYFPLRGQVIQ